MDSSIGRVHTGPGNLMTRTTNPCSAADPYSSGRVLAQALWKLAWSRDYDASGTLIPITGITNNNDFVEAVYFAAVISDNLTLEDFAWAFTYHAAYRLSILSAADIRAWCTVFGRHGLDGSFNSDCDLF